MLAAIPLFGSRVSPRCLFSDTMMVVRVDDGKTLSSFNHSIREMSEDTLLDELVELGVDTLICGGVAQDFIADAEICGLRVINNVAGEWKTVLAALEQGLLFPGFGLSKDPETRGPAAEEPEIRQVHCLKCRQRSCLAGEPCAMEAPRDGLTDPNDARIAEVAALVASGEEQKLCRVAELVHFAQGMGCQRLGVAFCVEMFTEAEILCGLLSRFFEVVPVCCRIGSGEDSPTDETPGGPSCNVTAQAEILNRAGVDLNLMVGLCVGCDLRFGERSQAPATTLFVKDRSLANNPVGALYSKYYLEDIAHKSAAPSRKGGRS